MKANVVCDALRTAVWQRRPQSGLIVYSDRGSQYAIKDYRRHRVQQLLDETFPYIGLT